MGRTPHGVRGLKYSCHYNHLVKIMSHPTRGAWIEILTVAESPLTSTSRTPHGVRGLKFISELYRAMAAVVAPHTGCVD